MDGLEHRAHLPSDLASICRLLRLKATEPVPHFDVRPDLRFRNPADAVRDLSRSSLSWLACHVAVLSTNVPSLTTHRSAAKDSWTASLATTGDLQLSHSLIDAHESAKHDAHLSHCRQRIVAFLLESRLYSLSERPDREILTAASERGKEDRYLEARREAGSVFC